MMLVTFLSALLLAADEPADIPQPASNDTAMPLFPTSPAFEALGATPTGILMPSTVREFGTDVAGFASSTGGGQIRGGLALEVTPIWTWGTASKTTLREWRTNSSARYSSWLALSLATTPGIDGSTLAAAGLRQVLYDDADPRWDKQLEHCLSEKIRDYWKDAPPPNPEDLDKPAAPVEIPGLGACRAEHERKYASGVGTSAAVAVALTTRFAERLISNFEWNSALAWATASLALGGDGKNPAPFQLVGTARYAYDLQTNQQEMLAGLRLRWATPSLSVSGDASWAPVYRTSGWNAGVLIAGFDVQVQLAKTAWLTATPAVRVETGQAPVWSGNIGIKLGAETIIPLAAMK